MNLLQQDFMKEVVLPYYQLFFYFKPENDPWVEQY